MKGIFRVVLVVATLVIVQGTKCQSSSIFEEVEYSSNAADGKVRIIQDDDIKTLVEKHQWTKSKYNGIVGYRIRIFSNSGPSAKAGYDRMMAQFGYSYDSISIHPEFDYPNYKIYVGDFRTESEALKFRKQIEHQFTGAFIVRRKINYPKLDLNE